LEDLSSSTGFSGFLGAGSSSLSELCFLGFLEDLSSSTTGLESFLWSVSS